MIEVKTLHKNKWISLRSVQDDEKGIPPYIYKHVQAYDGMVIAVLPYRYVFGKREFLLINEPRPCWSIDEGADDLNKLHLQSITGGIDFDESGAEAALRELVEETGYKVEEHQMIDLGTSRGSKASDTLYYLFTVDLTSAKQVGKTTNDPNEAVLNNEWVGKERLSSVDDPLTAQIYLRIN